MKSFPAVPEPAKDFLEGAKEHIRERVNDALSKAKARQTAILTVANEEAQTFVSNILDKLCAAHGLNRKLIMVRIIPRVLP